MASVQDLEEWMQEAGSALSITLVSPTASGVKPVATFHPKFTYPIFGDDEKIFGYKDLKISLRFRANDMRPHVHTTYSKKLKPAPGVEEPTNVVGVLDEGHHLPKIAFVKGSDFENGQYEVWRGSLDDAAVRQLNTRVQIFVPLFIEGGTYIGQDTESESPDINISDADRWTLFFLYKTQPSDIEPGKKSYIFVGYSTVYRFFFFQPPTPPQSPREDWELPEGHMDLAELPCRTRLSQFIILPPFQGQGNGHLLYKTIFDYYHKHPQTHEFTVENPSEVFDDLRDICDLTFLNTMPEFQALRLDSSVTIPKSGPMPALILGADTLEDVRKKAKIAPRQFARVLEMHLMSQLPPSVRPSLDLDAIVPEPTKADKHKERLWQLIVKQRLYKHNRELLAQIDQSERIEKLRETLTGVELEYARVLAAHERAMSHAETSPRRESNGKRKLDEAEAAEPSKKARVEDE
ncbi:histone acetyltransferase 1 [Purpureocillium lilacinum]|uniref:histone acetyltransferase 1 n=1 Tax=Purpureocillium lilacinum TaxID=33203 RepID=UPI0020857E0F|nr:histone acetyltransferase 1 [Purpureocillium lilacinum]